MSEQPLQKTGLNRVQAPGPSSREQRYFMDPKKGDAYGKGGKKNQPRGNFFRNIIDQLADTQGRAESLAQQNLKLDSEGRYTLNGRRVTGSFLGLPTFLNDADIFKVRQAAEQERLLEKSTSRNKITGITLDNNVVTTPGQSLTLLERAEAAGLADEGSKFYSKNSFTGISPAANLKALTKAVKDFETTQDLLTVAGDNGISRAALTTPDGELMTEGAIIKKIGAAVRKENQGIKDSGVLADAATQEKVLRRSDDYATRKALRELGYSDAAQERMFSESPGLSPQATAGLDLNAGAQRVKQRAVNTGMPAIDKMIQQTSPINAATPESLAATTKLQQGLIQGAVEANIGNHVKFTSPQSQYNRKWDTYKENTRKFENNQNYLRGLEAAEAEYNFKREQQRMDHEMKQFEIRETNKMLREQYEKELEIEESRRADADFDNLTRMIMGMAGNL